MKKMNDGYYYKQSLAGFYSFLFLFSNPLC